MSTTTDEIIVSVIEGTLCYLVRENGIILALKQRKIGKGKRNGNGGKCKPGESTLLCILREFMVESGGVLLDRNSLSKMAIIDFYNQVAGGVSVFRVHVFLATRWEGHPRDTDEMKDHRITLYVLRFFYL